MKKSVRTNGRDYPLVMVSDNGDHWCYKYHIVNCALGHVAGDLRFDGDMFHNVALWRFMKTNTPEKPKKKKYRPYNDEELERLFTDGVILVNKTVAHYRKVRVGAYRPCGVHLIGGWVGKRELFNDWKHQDGSTCGVQVGDDNPCGLEVDNDKE